MSNKYEEDGFKQYLKDKGLSVDDVSEEERSNWLEKKYKEYEDSKNSNNGGNEGNTSQQPEQNQAPKGNTVVSQNVDNGTMNVNEIVNEPEDNNWIEKKRNSWKRWCEEEHTDPYIYEENKEFKTGLEFDVYKTQKDKEEGNKAASIHYESERDVTISTEKGKTPDYEFFDKLAKEAKSDGVPGITFEGEMTPEFKARLAVACLENGLNIENGPEKIDSNLLGQNVSDEMKAKIETYNNEQFYKKAKEEAKAYKANKDNDGKPFEFEKDRNPKEVSMLFAAYQSAGVRVKGSYEALEANGGYFPLENLDFMTEEEKQPLIERNKRQKSIATTREKLDKLRAGEELKVSDEEKALLQERLDTEKSRAERLSKLSGIDNDKTKSDAEKQTGRQAIVDEYKKQHTNRHITREPLIEAYKNRKQNG